MSPTGLLSTPIRRVLGTIIVFLAVLLLAGGWAIPFTFESPSILYKFGMEKTYLRSGKVIGITIALLVFFQARFTKQRFSHTFLNKNKICF